MATCWSCEAVKGKRVCPARGGALICSKCCGTKRRIEIQCPDDCTYLHGANPNWQSANRQKADARFLARFLALNEKQVVFVLFLHHLLISTRARFAALSDDELEEVLGTATKTLETRAKGIVYSHQTSSPHLDQLADWLAKTVSEHATIKTAPDASDDDVAAVLRATLQAVRDHTQAKPRARYLETAEEVLRTSLGDAPAIEFPDELDEPPQNLIVSP